MKTQFICFALMIICTLTLAGWESVPSPVDSHLRSISYVSNDSVYIAGSEGAICHFNGTDWSIFTPVTDKNLNVICMLSDESGWAAGTEGTLLRYESNTWTVVAIEDEQRAYNDIIAFAEDDVYMIGYSLLGGTTLEHWDGTALTVMHTFSDNLSDMDGTGPDNLWVAGGNGYIAHYDGSSWDTSLANFAEPTKIFGMTLKDDGHPVLAAVEGEGWDRDIILEYLPDVGWVQQFQHWEKRIMTCDINEKRGFAMGSAGRVIEYSIFGWQELPALGTSKINDVILPDMSQGWAVADSGKIYRYTESAINLIMESASIMAGDDFDLTVELLNPGTAKNGIMEIIMLEAYGAFFFWPGWTAEFDSEVKTLPADLEESTAIFSFPWPSGAGSGEAAFWGALLDGQNNILGYDIEEFSWS